MIQSLNVVPTVADGNQSGEPGAEAIGRPQAGVSKWNAISKAETAAEMIVVFIVAANHFVSHVRGELPQLKPQTSADRRDVTEEELRKIHVVRHPSTQIAAGNFRDAGTGDQIKSENRTAWVLQPRAELRIGRHPTAGRGR
jgi:hypothetical protein